MNDLQKQMQDLECQFSFQQETIESLNTQVTKQWATIDKLTRQFEKLTEQMLSMESGEGKPEVEPPPPHY